MPKRKSERLTNGENSHHQGKQKRYQLERVNNSTEEEEEDVEMIPGKGKEAAEPEWTDAGTVERIVLKNFMCHGQLEVALGPNVNFIVGPNGGGKTAVVTALVVGLGGLATATSRGGNVRSFVQDGKSSAVVEIHLRNRGSDAYRHDDYGDLIKIRRQISATSSGSKYSIRNAEGQLVSDKLEELKRIKDFLNIQVDNPVVILNQTKSSNFMYSTAPENKYACFLKATQLAQMLEQYDEAETTKGRIACGIKQYEETLPELGKEVLRWEKKLKKQSAIAHLNERVKHLKHEIAWALVAEKERSLELKQKQLEEEEARLREFQQEVTASNIKLEQMYDVQRQLQADVEEVESLKTALRGKQDAFKAAGAAMRKAEYAIKSIKSDLFNVSCECQSSETRLQTLLQSAQHDAEAERQERMRSVEEQLQTAQERQRLTQLHREELQSAFIKHSAESASLKGDVIATRAEKTRHDRRLQTLQSARQNRYKRFGSWVPSALAKIDDCCRKGTFHRKPRGPLGAYLQLKDPSWTAAIERCLGSLTHSFVCHDVHDEQLLEDILQKAVGKGRRPSIITCRFQDAFHDVSRQRVRHIRFPCVLDMIQCDDPVVLNTLIDQRGIENVLLIADPAEALRVMLHAPPKNCLEAFALNCDHAFSQPVFRYFTSDSSTARCLASDVEEEILVVRGQVERFAQQLKELEEQYETSNRNVISSRTEKRLCETQLMDISKSIDNLNHELKELERADDFVPEIRSLEEEIQKLTQSLTELEERRDRESFQLARAQDEWRNTQRDVEEMRLKVTADRDMELMDKLSSAQTAVRETQQHQERQQDKLRGQEDLVTTLRARVEALKVEVEDDTRKAHQIWSQRVQTQRTPSDIEREVSHIIIGIRQQEEDAQESEEEIIRRYKETKSRFSYIQQDLKCCKTFIRKLDEALKKRTEAYIKFLKMLGLRLKLQFHRSLATGKFTGSLKIDHDKKTLGILVSPKEGCKINGNPMALSAGERSFSTVCLILSLWSSMECPIRCLDEYDIFMDMLKRRDSTNMIMDMTQNQTSKQFILLTPQDMCPLYKGFQVRPRIFLMPTPERDRKVQTKKSTDSI